MLHPTPFYYFVFSSEAKAKAFADHHKHSYWDQDDPMLVRTNDIEVVKILRRVAVRLPKDVKKA